MGNNPETIKGGTTAKILATPQTPKTAVGQTTTVTPPKQTNAAIKAQLNPKYNKMPFKQLYANWNNVMNKRTDLESTGKKGEADKLAPKADLILQLLQKKYPAKYKAEFTP